MAIKSFLSEGGFSVGSVGATPVEVIDSSGNVTAQTISGTNLTLSGNLTVNGSTVTINSTTTTVDDPIFTIGGDTAPTSDDNKDRGIEFRWHNGTSAKVGFFGYDDSTGYFTFIPDATNSSEVFGGTQGDIQATNFRGNLIGNITGSTTISGTATLSSDLIVNGTATFNNNVGIIRKQLTFSSSVGDPNHAIYNNYSNLDGEGSWDGMKINSYAGLRVRTGNAYGATPTQSLEVTSAGTTIGGTLTVNGTSATVTNSSGSSEVIVSRANSGSGATVTLKTGSTLKWYFGLRGLSDDHFYVQNEVGANTALKLDSSTSNATFTGLITTNGAYNSTTGEGSINVNSTDPVVAFYNSSNTANKRRFQIRLADDRVYFRKLNDALNTYTTLSTLDMDGNLTVNGTGTNYIAGSLSLSQTSTGGYTLGQTGILQLGNTSNNYLFSQGTWNSNITAGIIAHCADNWEFAIHDYGSRVASAFALFGGSSNYLQFGRDLGWGVTNAAFAGSVGIGTTSPTQKLHLNSGVLRISGGGANSNGEINLDSGTEYDGWQVRKESSTMWGIKSVTAGNDLAIFVDNATARGVYIKTSSGNVGIGTTNPSYKLEVFGDTGFRVVRTSNQDQHITLTGGDGSGVATVQAAYQLNLNSSSASYPMTFQIGGSEKLRISGAGNVGIGTTSPSSNLHVYSTGTGVELALEKSNTYAVKAGVNSSNIGYFGSTNATPLQIQTNGSARMYFDTSGNVGIGTTSPTYKLHVVGDARLGANGQRIWLYDDGNAHIHSTSTPLWINSDDSSGVYINNQNSGNVILTNTTAGSVGIGTTSPAVKFHVADNAAGIQQRISSSHANGTSLQFVSTSTNGRSMRIGHNFVTGAGEFAIYDDTAAATRVYINTSGNIGLGGNTNPQYKLDVNGSVNTTDWYYVQNSNFGVYNTAQAMYFSTNTNSRWNFSSGQSSIGLRLYSGGHNNTWRGHFYGDSTGQGFLDSAENWQMYVDSSNRLRVFSGIYNAETGIRILNPGGAAYVTQTSTITGAFKIRLPVDRFKSNTMMRMTVKIYQYSTGLSYEFEIGGYNYSDAPANWYNIFAEQKSDLATSPLTVRFGNDGTANCIWIGETTTAWTYPQVYVTEFQGGYSGTSAGWASGWSITPVTTFDTVTQSRTASQVVTANNISTVLTSTNSNLTIGGNATVSGGNLTLNSSGTGAIYFGPPSDNYIYYNGTNLYIRVGAGDRLVLSTSTATFSGNLTVQGTGTSSFSSGQVDIIPSTGNATLRIGGLQGGATNTILLGDGVLNNQWKITNPGSNGGILIKRGTDTMMSWTDNENLLIGTTSETGLTGSYGLKVASTTASTSTSTGALVVAGGVGIGGAANVGGNLTVSGTSTLTGNVGITGTLGGTSGTLTMGSLVAFGTNLISTIGGHNFFQGDATRTYLYGGTNGLQIRKSDNSAAIVTVDDSGNLTVSGTGTSTVAGNLIVGTTTNNTSAKLFVDTSINTDWSGTIALRYNVSGQTNSYYKGLAGTNINNGIARGLSIFNYDADTNLGIQFFPAAYPGMASPPVAAMVLNSSGNLGVGTASPGGRLHVSGGDAILNSGSAGNSPKLIFGGEYSTTDKSIYLSSYWMTFRGHNNEGFKFITANASGTETERFRIAGSGTVSCYGDLAVTGNFTVSGTTTTVNSTTATVKDPILTLGGGDAGTAASSDDNKDRGIEFKWHNGTAAKTGFFGFQDSTGYLTFIPDATNTSEVFSGTLGDIQATNFRGNLIGNVTGNVSGTAGSETLATVTGRGASTSTAVTLSNTANHYAGHHYFDAFDNAGNHYPHYQAGGDGTGAIANIRVAQSGGTHKLFILNGKDGSISWNGNTVWHAGNDGAGSGLDADLLDGYNQDTANTANTIVRRDGSGNFSAGTISATNVGIGVASPSGLLNILAGTGTADGTVAIRIGGPSNYPSLELGTTNTYDGFIRSYGNDLKYYAGHWRTVGTTASENHRHYWYTSKNGSADWSTAKMLLTEDGYLGIGTGFTPSAKLHVSGGRTYLSSSDGYELAFARSSSYFYFYNDGNNTTGKLTLTDTVGISNPIITFTQDTRNVGIGTTSPAHKLHILSSAGQDGINIDAVTYPEIVLYRNSVAKAYIAIAGNAGGYTASPGSLADSLVVRSENAIHLAPAAGGYVSLTAATNGNIGIGITSPSSKLHVQEVGTDGTPAIRITTTSAPSTFSWATSAINSSLTAGKNYIHLIGQAESSNNSGYIGFNYQGAGSTSNFVTIGHYGNNNLLNITAAGYVGIGITNPQASLDIKSVGVNIYRATDTSNQYRWRVDQYFAMFLTAANGSDICGIEQSKAWFNQGNVGIGTASPSVKLHVAGSTIVANNTSINPDSYLNQVVAGAISTGSWGVSSAIGGSGNTGHAWAIGTNSTRLYFAYGDGASANTLQSFIEVNTNRNMTLMPTSGNVGIGIASPFAKTTINRTVSTGVSTADSGNTSHLTLAGSDALVRLQMGAGGAALGYAGWIQASYDNTGGNNGTEPLLLNPVGGQVGIGVTSTSYRLHVAGDIYASSGAIRVNSTNSFYFETYGGGWYMEDTSWIRTVNYKNIWTGTGLLGSNGGLTVGYGGTAPNTTYGAIIAGSVGIGTSTPGYKLEVNGSFAATTKSFVIPHPTKPGKKLRYGSLEGPENGVYVRGRLKGSNTIELPDYWEKLVDPDSITVNLTPIGKHQKLYVDSVSYKRVIVEKDGLFSGEIDCYYTIFAERIDVEKLQVEIDAK